MSASRLAMMRRRRRRTNASNEGPSGRTRLLVALLMVGGFFVVAGGLVAGGTGLYAMSRYDEIADDVVPPEELIAQQSRGGAKIFDRNGEILYEFVDELAGLRRPIGLAAISQNVLNATIAVEDPTFYENNGVNTRGLFRAGVENFLPFLVGDDEFFEGSGGSSITQQLAKNIYIPREERTQRSVDRKIKETVIALELTKKYSKDQILEWYLNSISYGGIYTGIEAASQGYFGKPASELTLSEASLLAGIPQSPALYDPFSPANRDSDTGQLLETSLAKQRQAEVLDLMVRRSYITQDEAEAALETTLELRQQRYEILAPHFVLGRIAQELEARFGPRAAYEQGLVVHTTLDMNLQRMAEEVVERNITDYGEQANLFNGAFVAIDPRTSEILTYVGSRDYFRDDIEGRNDNAIALNSPGSTLKPFTFMAAFMNGWGTGTAILDTPLEIVDYSTGGTFSPRDPIGTLLGPITAASALGNSLNITAVKAIMYAGVPQTIQLMNRMGFTTFDNPGGYGPALTTGGGEVTLLDSVYAYATIATNGIMRGQEAITTPRLDPGERTLEPIAILRVEDSEGKVLLDVKPEEQRVVAAEYPYLVTSVLSDGQNHCITYRTCGALALPNGYPSAAKTGTSEPFEDSRQIGETWTVGYTPELVSGIWAGNADNSPISGITSTSVSLRGWKEFMVQAIEYLELPPTPFERPSGVVSREVCWPSGKLPTETCPNTKRYNSLYAAEALPGENPSEDERERLFDTWWQSVPVDTRTGRIANDLTPAQFVSNSVRLVMPKDEVEKWGGLHEWAARNGVAGMVGGATPADASGDLAARIDTPAPNADLSGRVNVRGRALSDDLVRYRLEWGRGANPNSWVRINSSTSGVRNGLLGTWDTASLPDGAYSLRVIVEDEKTGTHRYEIPVRIDNGDDSEQTDSSPLVGIVTPTNAALVSGSVNVTGTGASANLLQLRLEYGVGVSPTSWTTIQTFSTSRVGADLGTWDTTQVPDGAYTLRVVVVDEVHGDSSAERLVVVRNDGSD